MSNINYSYKNKGVRVIDSKEAWVLKNKKPCLNKKYIFIGKFSSDFPEFIISAKDNVKPVYKATTSDLNIPCKKQLVNSFFDKLGKRNKRSVAYLAIKKKGK